MTDMSPAAIKDRLHIMDELWLLSVKLMHSKERSLAQNVGVVSREEEVMPGREILIESDSPLPSTGVGVFFEDDGETGYFYGVATVPETVILDALHIYNVKNLGGQSLPSRIQIVWSSDGLKSALVINDCFHAVIDFESRRAYCRTGFPHDSDWSDAGHKWSDDASDLFV